MKNVLLSGITFQPFHHDMPVLRGCHYRINIFCTFTRDWLDTGGQSTNPTLPYTAPD